MTSTFNLIFEYINDGGMVSYALMGIFFVISYTIGYRISLLYKGRNLSVRSLFLENLKNTGTVQEKFLNDLSKIKLSSIDEFEQKSERLVIDAFQNIHKFAGVLNTAVLLAPLLGLLGTVIGMIAVSYTHLTLPTTPYV